ncbi:hypothetical protein Tco_0154315 [Tanacetum coccineum]
MLRRKEERSLINTSFLGEYECSSLALESEGRDEKKRLDHLKQDQEMLVIKIFSERKKVFKERKKCEKIRAKRDCMMVVNEIVSRLLEEVEKLEWWFEQDIDDEEEDDEEGESGSEEEESAKYGLANLGNDSLRM